ncbi:Maleylacetate reductase [Burkholderiaceae bacterium 16]|nr:Maleylacetate reductase [Burkholderiaceae bacterium 16]
MSCIRQRSFVYSQFAGRVVFSAGAVRDVAAEVRRLGCRRVLVLSTPEQRGLAESVREQLAELAVGLHDGAQMHVPVGVVRDAQAVATQLGADGFITVGGGSTTGLGKMLTLESGLPLLVIPTTYAGSEVTPLYGTTQDKAKTTGKNPAVLPKTVIYDPELTLDLPLPVSLASGMNAIAHAAEGLYAADLNPVIRLMALEGISALARALPALRDAPRDIGLRADCLYGAWLCGMVLANVGMGLHHKACHVLGGSFALPHAEMHAVMLPHALAYNASAAAPALASLSVALGGSGKAGDAPGEVFALLDLLRLPTALSALGMPEDGLDRAARRMVERPYPNPRPLEQARLRTLLDDAFHGRPPRIDVGSLS